MTNDTKKQILSNFFNRNARLIPKKSIPDMKVNILDAVKFIEAYEKSIDSILKITCETEEEYMDVAKYLNNKTYDNIFRGISYTHRFMKQATSEQKKIIKEINTNLFYEGLLVFLTKDSNIYRYKYLKEYGFTDLVFEVYIPNILISDIIMKEFNKQNNNLLKKLFEMIYQEDIMEKVETNLKSGFLQNSKNNSYFYNIFASGFVLGMINDIESKEYK